MSSISGAVGREAATALNNQKSEQPKTKKADSPEKKPQSDAVVSARADRLSSSGTEPESLAAGLAGDIGKFPEVAMQAAGNLDAEKVEKLTAEGMA